MKVFGKLIKKSLAYTLSLQLSCAPLMASHMDDILGQAKPERTYSLVFVDKKRHHYAFKEYFLGTNGNDCFFNALGVTRADAVDKVTSALARGSVITAQLLDKAIEDQINEPHFAGLDDLSPQDRRAAYLERYRSGSLMIECAQKIGETGSVADNIITLFNVFSYVYRRNISVYKPSETITNRLDAFHITRYADCTTPTLHLILKGSHFNRLIRTNQDPLDHEIARLQENIFMDALRTRLLKESIQTCHDDVTLPAPSFAQDEARPSLPSSSSSQAPIFIDDAPLQDAPAPSTAASSSRSALSRDQVFQFLLNKTRTFEGRSYKASRQDAWDTLSTWLTSYDKFAGLATLLLDHRFTPRGEERAHAIKNLISKAPRAWLSKSQQHQINLYLGRLHLENGNLSSAWSYFHGTISNLSYSQVGRLYMAQMIIDDHYRPAHLKNPLAYADKLLEPIGHAGRSAKRTERPGEKGDKEIQLHNPYLNQTGSHQTADDLKRHLLEKKNRQGVRTQKAQAPSRRADQQEAPTQSSPSTSARTSSSSSSSSSSSASMPSIVRDDLSSSSESPTSPAHDEIVLEPAQKKQRPLSDATPPVQERGLSSPEEGTSFFDDHSDESDFFRTACPAPAGPVQDDASPSHVQNSENEENEQDASVPTLNNNHLEAFVVLDSKLLQAKSSSLAKDFHTSLTLCQNILAQLRTDLGHLQDTQAYKTLKAKTLLQMANSRFCGEIDGVLHTSDSVGKLALDLATETQDLYLKAAIHIYLGNAQSSRPYFVQNSEAFGHYKQAFEFYKKNNNISSALYALHSMARSSAPQDAITYLDEGISLCGSGHKNRKKNFQHDKNKTLRVLKQQAV